MYTRVYQTNDSLPPPRLSRPIRISSSPFRLARLIQRLRLRHGLLRRQLRPELSFIRRLRCVRSCLHSLACVLPPREKGHTCAANAALVRASIPVPGPSSPPPSVRPGTVKGFWLFGARAEGARLWCWCWEGAEEARERPGWEKGSSGLFAEREQMFPIVVYVYSECADRRMVVVNM